MIGVYELSFAHTDCLFIRASTHGLGVRSFTYTLFTAGPVPCIAASTETQHQAWVTEPSLVISAGYDLHGNLVVHFARPFAGHLVLKQCSSCAHELQKQGVIMSHDVLKDLLQYVQESRARTDVLDKRAQQHIRLAWCFLGTAVLLSTALLVVLWLRPACP